MLGTDVLRGMAQVKSRRRRQRKRNAVSATDRSWDKANYGREEEETWRFDFSNTDLRYANLTGIKGADLSGAHLERAHLSSAHLEGANLNGAHLEGAVLSLAQLEGAELLEAHLERADLSLARLENAGLCEAHLEGAVLSLAQLEGADLTEATGLTTEMLETAFGDVHTKLPDGVARPQNHRWTSEPDAGGTGQGG
jgi:uncharacterized protein YjbI with pentapeptide repeats